MSATFPPQGVSESNPRELSGNLAVLGLHHMSAVAGPAQENLDFYGTVLGLRLVKLTVNFDDPSAYHLYYGNGTGEPGTLLTFFPYPKGYPGRPGVGQVTLTSLAIPANSLGYWQKRFADLGIDTDRIQRRSGYEVLPFRGPDGLLLELATAQSSSYDGWGGSDIPFEHAILGMRAVVLRVPQISPTRRVLTDVLGFRPTDEKERRHRFEVGKGGIRHTVEVVEDSEGIKGRSGHGTVHHVAFRTDSEESLLQIREKVLEAGLHVGQVMNRDYFKSIYFREPGGILFEVATDPPGFTVDEPFEELGTQLRLPSQYEPYRGQIEKNLPKLSLPKRL